MSNENSTINKPRSLHVSSRCRKFSCITYLSELQLKTVLCKHHEQIRCYAYAFHDKDAREDGTLKEPHFHIVLVTYNTCTISAIRRWFCGFVDSNGDITTTAQKCTDVFEMYDYLTHSTFQARAQGKYQYDKSIVVTNDTEYFKANVESEFDSITLSAEMLLNGASVRECGRKFGRDFILHYPAIKKYLTDVFLLNQRADINNINDLIILDLSK